MAFERVLPILRRIPVTIGLTLLVTAVFAAELWVGITLPGLQRMGAMNAERVAEHGEVWRLITPMFLHGGWIHFGLNTFALVQLAALTEILFGSYRLLGFTLVCGVAASLASAVMNPVWMFSGVGASGFLFGLVGLILGLSIYGAPHWRVQLAKVRRALVFTVGIGLAMFVADTLFGVFVGSRMVDHWAHLGGFVTGLLLAAAYPEPEAPTRGWERSLAFAALGAYAGSFAAAVTTGVRVLETLPDQTVRAPDARLDAASTPLGQGMTVALAIQGMHELEVEDRDARLHGMIDRLSPDALLYAVSLVQATDEYPDEGIWLAERWAELAPEESNPANVLAWLLVTHPDEGRRDPERALDEIDRALDLLPEDESVEDDARPSARAAYLDTRAETLLQLGRLQEALTDQREAVDLGEAEDVGELEAMKDRLTRIEQAIGS